MRVLDLGCGKGRSSVFLAKEFGVNVVAVDLWNSAADNAQVIRDAGLSDHIESIQADARNLPFANDHFDIILAIDAFQYFGTDALYLPYILKYLKPGGQIAFASAGLTNDFENGVPQHLEKFWQPDAWCLQTSDWWRHHWERTGLVNIHSADTMVGGWKYWLAWAEINGGSRWYTETVKNDAGRFLGYVRTIATRIAGRDLLPYDLRTGC